MATKEPAYTLQDFKGALFDLDGVITNTASLHASAWKTMFDQFLEAYGKAQGQSYQFLSIAEDYPRYIDGKPRLEGIRAFLASRGISLPEGRPDDGEANWTVQGLGNWKNQLFRELLADKPVEVYQENVDKIWEWRKSGIKTAVISSSKNCATILDQTKLEALFDVRVDGVLASRLGLKGKPQPDIFLEGVRRLGLKPSECLVFEDALSGVQAGNEGDFGLVIGITTTNTASELIKNGADLAVENFDTLSSVVWQPRHQAEQLADALTAPDIHSAMASRKPALFFDYDGTLTPIVNNPQDAILSPAMRDQLEALAPHFPIAIISGRDRTHVKDLVQLDNVYYAGSHGFDISGPNGMAMESSEAQALLPHLDQAEQHLTEQTAELEGVLVERKRFAIAVHYRNASETVIPDLKALIENLACNYQDLKIARGKKIFELKPNVDWDKGKAMEWLMDQLGLNAPQTVPFYLGDDLTDEDAFRVLIDKGFGILVGDHGHRTFAGHQLAGTDQVYDFCNQFYQIVLNNEQ